MANDLNQCNFTGRAGADSDLRYTTSGVAVANVNIAVGKSFKDKDGQRQERTEWVSLVAWGKLAELFGKYVLKGKQIRVTGEMQTQSYDNRDGVKVYKTEIVVSDLQLLGTQNGNDSTQSGSGGRDSSQSRGFDDPVFDPDKDLPF